MASTIGSSIKKIFGKGKSTTGQTEQVQAYSPDALVKEVKSTGNSDAKKPKHGEDGVCCGRCS
jgi:CCGSCS motif protein